MAKQECLNKIKKIEKLEYNWNRNKANPIPKKVIENSKTLLDYLIYFPFITPTANQSIQFEYQTEKEYLEIEIFQDRFELFKIYEDKSERERTYPLSEMFKVINHIKILFNGNPNNVVLFTGAFNPPTIAHYYMIDSALENTNFDYVFFALSNATFLSKKQNRKKDWYFSEEQRLHMILLMTYRHPKVLIYGIEDGWTYDVLCQIKKRYSCNNVYFACGSDKIKQIPRWSRNNKLLREFCFYILIREDNYEDIKKQCDKIFCDTKYKIGNNNKKYSNVSATMIRNAIKENKDFEQLVYPDVYKYLKPIRYKK